MDEKLLRNYIQELLHEKAQMAPGFNVNALKGMKTVPEIYNYVKKYLRPMGRGSSRMTFLLGPKKILKLAKNQAGISQNEAEVDVFTSPATKNVVSKIYSYDPQYKWLVSELVKPLSWDEFENITRWGWQEFIDCLKSALGGGGFQEKDVPKHMQKWFNSIIQVAKAHQLGIGDLKVEDHYGKSADGNIVLLDYGLTQDVGEKHYMGADSQGNQKYPKNFAGISKTNQGPQHADTEDLDWGDTFG